MSDPVLDRVKRILLGQGAEPLRAEPEVPPRDENLDAVREAPAPVGIWGYPDTYSYLPGQTMGLHVSASTPFFGLKVFHLRDWYATAPELLFEMTPRPIAQHQFGPVAGNGSDDWQWASNAEVPVGNWPSGIYVAQLGAYDKWPGEPVATHTIEFVVKNPGATPAARILYKLNLNTVQAYSLGMQDGLPEIPPFNRDYYVNVPPRGPRGYKLTFRRPVWSWAWNNKSVQYDYAMVRWLEAQEYAADFCTDVDVHLDRNLDLLGRYDLLLSIGHDEYWSAEMRQNVEAFRDAGGNVAFLSGNTVCWRVHFTDVDPAFGVPTAFECDKGPPPLCDVSSDDAWWRVDPENKLVGVGTRNCAIRLDDPNGPFSPTTPSSPGYRIQNANDPLLRGTIVADGFTIGLRDVIDRLGNPVLENLIGYEGGGARVVQLANRNWQATLTDGTPSNFVILGVGVTAPVEGACSRSPCGGPGQPPCTRWWSFSREDNPELPDVYAATMGYYRKGEALVFTGSTIHWANILNEWDTDGGAWRDVPLAWEDGRPERDAEGHPILGNPYLHRITRNVIDTCLAPARTAGVRRRRRAVGSVHP